MIHHLPKHYRKKYKKERSWDENILLFIFKIVGSTALFFVVAAGIDIYHFVH